MGEERHVTSLHAIIEKGANKIKILNSDLKISKRINVYYLDINQSTKYNSYNISFHKSVLCAPNKAR